MLKYIATITLLVNQLASVEAPYRDELGYQAVHRGVISAEPEIGFGVVVQTMDAARHGGDRGELFADVVLSADVG